MAKALFQLGRWSFVHRKIVIIAWIIILAAVGGAAGALQKGFSDAFELPGAPSSKAAKLLTDTFGDAANPIKENSVTLVFGAPEGEKLTDPENSAAVDEVVSYIKDNVGQISSDMQLANPVTLDPKQRAAIIDGSVESGMPRDVAERDAYFLRVLSDDATVGTARFVFGVDAPDEIKPENRQGVIDAMEMGREAGLEVNAMGPGFFDPVVISPISEIVGMGVAFLVMVIAFGSVVAAGLPLISAMVGVGIGGAGIVLLTAFYDVNSSTPVLAIMIGLAVGIDYALLIMARYRAELVAGIKRADAAGLACGTAGSSVVFAGLTVLIALAALVAVQIPFLSLMGISAAVTVAMAVLISLTFVPAMFGVFGSKIFAWSIPGVAGNPVRGKRVSLFGSKTMGRRWVELVHRFPALFLIAVLLGLVALALPARHLDLALPSDSTLPYDSTQRQAVMMAEDAFGPGSSAQIIGVVDAREVDADAPALAPLVEGITATDPEKSRADAARLASFSYSVEQLKNNAHVGHVQIIGVNDDQTAAQLLITPTTGPLNEDTKKLIQALRAQQNQIETAAGIGLGFTGLVPIMNDVTDQLADAMPIYLAIVVGLAIILLLLVFRSLTVPLTAGVGFLLSVGAAFGLTVLFWQDGLWGLVDTPGPLISFMPIFLIGVTFGLAMDYQVFLVSRMREHYTKSRGKATEGSGYTAVEESVVEGFALGARVVTAAAIIMTSVFVAFIGQDLAFVKIFGFALGAAVLFDAFLVRMTFIPASMFLLGRAVWWLPKWLDRILPSVDVEGEGIEDHRNELLAEAKRASGEELTTSTGRHHL
ncbi:MMPL family transporter [Corynebacterium sp. TAE3-ERU12]|uniref:MMPL family transporter n=1 Tax=Corynebacterium sp. TAE3-ERU12 TaxID=2849491 RepID=UPI001C467243|nr:MMPL family transporter [Corynebacterium sp. TAE3-ERU12]MBV7294428.1 MMPL family transporter [Corynebacterium sp. TAE3-ERU12]